MKTFLEYYSEKNLENIIMEAIMLEMGNVSTDDDGNKMLSRFVQTLKSSIPFEKIEPLKNVIQKTIDKVRGGSSPIDFSTISRETNPETIAAARKFGGSAVKDLDDQSLGMWLGMFNRDLRNSLIGDDLSKVKDFGKNLSTAAYFRKFADWFQNRAFHTQLPQKTTHTPYSKADIAAILTRTAGRIIDEDPFSQEAVINALRNAIQNDQMFQKSLAYLNRSTKAGQQSAEKSAQGFVKQTIKSDLKNRYGINNPDSLFPKQFEPQIKYSDISKAIKDSGQENTMKKLKAQINRRQKRLQGQ